MPRRLIDIAGTPWSVTMSGRYTQYNKDEFTILFRRVGEAREERAARYSPQGSKSREDSLAELSDAALIDLYRRSQPSWTTADTGYHA